MWDSAKKKKKTAKTGNNTDPMVEHMAEAVKSIKEQERILQLNSTTDDQFGKILSENFVIFC